MTRIDQLKKFISGDASVNFSRYALGLEYLKEEKYKEAENCFQFLIENHPEYISTYYQYGKLLQQARREKEAKNIFRKGMELTRTLDLKTYSELQNALTNLELGLEN